MNKLKVTALAVALCLAAGVGLSVPVAVKAAQAVAAEVGMTVLSTAIKAMDAVVPDTASVAPQQTDDSIVFLSATSDRYRGKVIKMPHGISTWMGTYKVSGVQVACVNYADKYKAIKPSKSTTKITGLVSGGSEAVRAIANKFMSSVNTSEEAYAIRAAFLMYDSNATVRSDANWASKNYPGTAKQKKKVLSLYGKYKALGNLFLGGAPKVTVSGDYVVATGGQKIAVSVTLSTANGKPMVGYTPTGVTATNGTVSSITKTNSKGIATFMVTADAAGTVSVAGRFAGLPSWKAALVGYKPGYQHLVGGKYSDNIPFSKSFEYKGVASGSLAVTCDEDCDTTVPVTLTGKNPGGSEVLRVEALVDDKSLGHIDIKPGSSDSATIKVANGNRKDITYRGYYVDANGERVGDILFSKTITIVCPPAPDVTITVSYKCGTACNASATVASLPGANETYEVKFYLNGVQDPSVATVTEGHSASYTWSAVKGGDEIGAIVDVTDANGKVHTWRAFQLISQ